MLYPEHFEDKIGFTPLRLLLTDLSETTVGMQFSQELPVSFDYDTIALRLGQTSEARDILIEKRDFPELAAVELSRFIGKGKIEGAFLDVPEWLEIRRMLHSVRQVVAFFGQSEPSKFPLLRKLADPIKYSPLIHEKIDQVFNRQGEVKDQASPDLKRIRVDIQRLQVSVSRSMDKIIQKARAEGWIDKDTQASLREGRLVIPLPSAHKRKVRGLIHDESATGKTSFVEPVELVEMNNEIRELELAERREIVKILTQLTQQLRPYFGDMEIWNAILGEMDHIRARARLSVRWKGIHPDLIPEPYIEWNKVRHPHLLLMFMKEGREVVPQHIRLDAANRVLIISGPNAGGKSVCMKTVGLVQYIIQLGILPPMDEGSKSGIFTRFLLDIGDEQSLENDLSTYSSHLMHMKHFIKHSDAGTLFLIDEFGAGTEPQVGGAMAEAILGELVATGAFGVITTHYANLKHFGSLHDGVANGAMLFDVQKMRPMFMLETGKPGSSFAFEIARTIGLPETVLQKASDLVGSDHTRFDKNLREIARDKRYWEKKRQNIRQSEKALEELLAQYAGEVERLRQDRDKHLKQLKLESGEILSGLNQRIEQTIREIRENQADKEKTRELRAKLDHDRNALVKRMEELDLEGKKLAAKVETEKKKLSKRLPEKVVAKPIVKEDPEYGDLRPGQKIRVISKGFLAEVIEHRKGSLLVAVGQMLTTVNEKDVELVAEDEFRKQTGSGQQTSRFRGLDLEYRKLNFSPQVDLRGCRGDDAIQKVTEFLDEAIMVGERNLRILHGKGDGILRQMIRDYLSTVDVVDSYKDEDIRVGGSGITIVKLAF